MLPVFSALVGSTSWLEEATSWIEATVHERGGRVTGPVEQPRIRPWSTQLVVPTTAGRLWFKANCEALAFEPALHALLAQLDPTEVDSPYAVDAQRGWVLTIDRGSTLAEDHEPTLADWQAVVRAAARIQRSAAGHRDELLATGLPDCGPETVPARYEQMTARLEELAQDHPSHLSSARASALRRGRGTVEQAVATVLSAPLPATVQHGDLHPRNVFVAEGGLRVFDFGDAQWAHPLEMLAVPWGWLTQLTELPFEPVLEAYAQEWDDLLSPQEVQALLPSAMVLHAVNRSLTWWGSIAQAAPAELVEWGDAPRHYLELSQQPFPPAEVSG